MDKHILLSTNCEKTQLFNPVIIRLLGIVCFPVACFLHAKNCKRLKIKQCV